MQFRAVFLKNAASNVVRGGAGLLVAIALPHFLTRLLDPERFAVWVLVLQMAAYANYLDFGLQTAISRFVAQAIELRQDERLDQIVSTSTALLWGACVVAFLLIGAAIWEMPYLFRELPLGLYSEFRSAAFVLAGSAVLVVALSTYTSTLLGLHRNELVAMTIGLSRLGGAVAAVVVARHTQSLVLLACCIGGANLLGSLAQIPLTKSLLPNLKMKVANVRRSVAAELARYCAGLTVWYIGLLIVSGLDLLLVGHYAFEAVGSYSIALSAAAVLGGVNSYIITALLAPLAVLHARRDMKSIQQVLLKVTSIDVAMNAVVAVSAFLFALPILRVWVGAYATQTLPILEILLIAQAIRLSGLAFSVTLVAIGQQNKGMAQGWMEAIVNLTCSLIGIHWFGPIGVAWGTLFGSITSLVWIVFVSLPRIEELPLSSFTFLKQAILKPAFCALPLLAVSLAMPHMNAHLLPVLEGFAFLLVFLLARRAGLFSKALG